MSGVVTTVLKDMMDYHTIAVAKTSALIRVKNAFKVPFKESL